MAEKKMDVDGDDGDDVDVDLGDYAECNCELVVNQNLLKNCIAILQRQYDEVKLSKRVERLVKKMVFEQMYGDNWPTAYENLHKYKEIVLHVPLPEYVYQNPKLIDKFNRATFPLQRNLQRQFNEDAQAKRNLFTFIRIVIESCTEERYTTPIQGLYKKNLRWREASGREAITGLIQDIVQASDPSTVARQYILRTLNS